MQAIIDLKAIAANYHALQALAAPAKVAGVVKANAYGLGAVEVSTTLYAQGCRRFYVADMVEAMALRPLLPNDAALMVFGGVPQGAENDALRHNITAVINHAGTLEAMQNVARQKNKMIDVVIHIDTGMNRLGFNADEWRKLTEQSGAFDGLNITHVLSHLTSSDEPQDDKNSQQRDAFAQLAMIYPRAKKSFANSHGIFLGKDYCFDEVRPGRALSGTSLDPRFKNPLQMALSLYAPILQIRTIEKDGTAGYNTTQRVTKGMRIATIAAGYADGLHRTLSNSDSAQNHYFYIGDHKAPVLGRVSMDLTILDMTHIPEDIAPIGAQVELVGPHQTIDALATQAGTIGYELMTHIAPRVTRSYVGS